MTTQIEMSLESETWVSDSVPAVLIHHPVGNPFTADDLHLYLPPPPHHNAYGTLLNSMARKGLIEHVGYAKSNRPARNGGLIRVWRVK